jgi:hypothetical protein
MRTFQGGGEEGGPSTHGGAVASGGGEGVGVTEESCCVFLRVKHTVRGVRAGGRNPMRARRSKVS